MCIRDRCSTDHQRAGRGLGHHAKQRVPVVAEHAPERRAQLRHLVAGHRPDHRGPRAGMVAPGSSDYPLSVLRQGCRSATRGGPSSPLAAVGCHLRDAHRPAGGHGHARRGGDSSRPRRRVAARRGGHHRRLQGWQVPPDRPSSHYGQRPALLPAAACRVIAGTGGAGAVRSPGGEPDQVRERPGHVPDPGDTGRVPRATRLGRRAPRGIDGGAGMSLVAPTLQAFFTERLIRQRQASPHTVTAYRDTFRQLFTYVANTTGTLPAQLDFADLEATTVAGFLTHLEDDRGVSVATRNARLAALRSLFRYASFRHPEHADLIARVLAIPSKRGDRPLVTFLNKSEIDALLAAPDRTSWTGHRDHALLAVAIQTGLRVSELTGLRRVDVAIGRGAHVRVMGKGRKERVTPLSKHSVATLRVWLEERGGDPEDPVFPSPAGTALGRDAVRKLVVKYARIAAGSCPTLGTKHVGVHTLRHSCAMTLLDAGVDLATIALWLGHEDLRTVQHYLHADLALKERALERTTPPNSKAGRYRPSDPVLAFLDGL